MSRAAEPPSRPGRSHPLSDHARALVEVLSADAPGAVQDRLASAQPLADFRAASRRALSPAQRRTIVDQALVLIERNYVHLPLKAAMHAVDPIQRLRLLQATVAAPEVNAALDDLAFHRELLETFHSVRDLHTNYVLPEPFSRLVAFLPFLVETYWEGDERSYVVTHVVQGFDAIPAGAKVTYWNGMPIDRAVDVNAARFAGSNAAARHARGVESLTLRPLAVHLPPDEDWVVVSYLTPSGDAGGFAPEVHEARIPWLVLENLPAPDENGNGQPPDGIAERLPAKVHSRRPAPELDAARGIDLGGAEAGLARKLLFASDVAAAELQAERSATTAGDAVDAEGWMVGPAFQGVFRVQQVPHGDALYGHIRIHTFDVDDPWAFVEEFVRLAETGPQDGLILDVRGNGGGHIWAAELLLQTLTPRPVTPEPSELIRTPLNLRLCQRHQNGEFGLDLGPWLASLDEGTRTGAVFSRGFPITPASAANAIGQRYYGPVVLITDAKCYSATDIFAAGFQDHEIGEVIGIDRNTGAGGANVWDHQFLSTLLPGRGSPYQQLPGGVAMRVSMRRTLRVGAAAGTPLEDLGITPTIEHRMTWRDVMEGNADLLALACERLARSTAYRFGLTGRAAAGEPLTVKIESAGIDRVDFYVDGRPRQSVDVDPQSASEDVVVPGAEQASELRVEAFDQGRLVAVRRAVLSPGSDGSWGIVDRRGGPFDALAVPPVIRFLVHAPGADLGDVRAAVTRSWGEGFTVEHLFADGGASTEPPLDEHFAVTGRLPEAEPDARRRRAFELARALMRHTGGPGAGGYEVQPDLGATVFTPDRDDDPELRASGRNRPALPGTDDPAWALETLRVPAVRNLPGGQGDGIVIGHPDTGYTIHADLGPDELDLTADRDVLANDDDARDPLRKLFGLIGNPGHGTATASVIVSRPTNRIEGAAPAARLVPIRAVTSVALVFDGDVAKAVDHARRTGCHVISMSLGGVGFSSSLRAAIRAALADGLLVLAAAGNEVGFVVAPASYHEVVAVAATNIEDRPWAGSSRGPAVDVSAPGESVPAAEASKQFTDRTKLGSGTSYAVALTAGVGALWLAHHGRDALIARYGAPNLQRVFRHLLRRTARKPLGGWDGTRYGAGIVDAAALLAAPLPDLGVVDPFDAVGVGTPTDRLVTTLSGLSAGAVHEFLDEALGDVPPGERELYAGELAFLMAHEQAARAELSIGSADPAGTARLLERLRAAASPSLAANIRASV